MQSIYTGYYKKLGREPVGARLYIEAFQHEFGTYLEVVCEYDTDKIDSYDYALRCESDGPLTWKEVGMEGPKW